MCFYPVSAVTTVGAAPSFPDEVTADLDNGDWEGVDVKWDSVDPSEYAAPGTFTVFGTAQNTDVKAVAEVTVASDLDSIVNNIISVDPVSVSTKVGTAPKLPGKVTAEMTNGTAKEYAVSWSGVDPSEYADAGEFTVSGNLSGTLENFDVSVTAEVIVTDSTYYVKSVGAVSVKTFAGVAPVLPHSVTAKLSDGTTENVGVKWSGVKSSEYAKTGKFSVKGTVNGLKGNAVAGVTVTDNAEDNPYLIESITPDTVVTTLGKAPSLPDDATAFLKNGTFKSVDITWDKIDPSEYSSVHSFIEKGSVAGSDVKAVVVVKVTGGNQQAAD